MPIYYTGNSGENTVTSRGGSGLNNRLILDTTEVNSKPNEIDTSELYNDELGGGLGDLVGPASATDDALVRFDGTTGKLVQDSTVIVSDGGIVQASAVNFGSSNSQISAGTSGFGVVLSANSAIVNSLYTGNNRLTTHRQIGLAWDATSSGAPFGGILTSLYCDDTAILNQRNGTAAQTWRIANTFTSTTDFEALQVRANSTEYQIGSAIGSAGGTARDVHLGHWDSASTFTQALTVGTNGQCTVYGRFGSPSGTTLILAPQGGNASTVVSSSGNGIVAFQRNFITVCQAENDGFAITSDKYVRWGTDLYLRNATAGVLSIGVSATNDGALDCADITGSGTIMFSSLPTSDPAVAGQLWNDSGTVKVSAG